MTIIVIAVVVIVTVSAAAILLGGDKAPTDGKEGADKAPTDGKEGGDKTPADGKEEEATMATPGRIFSIELTVTKDLTLGYRISELLVAVPESFKVEEPTSASVRIRVVRESHEGYNIHGVNITTLSRATYDPRNPPSVDLNLTAPRSMGTYEIYVTTAALSDLGKGQYAVGDLTFLAKKEIEVALTRDR
jgi:hypothetical protein